MTDPTNRRSLSETVPSITAAEVERGLGLEAKLPPAPWAASPDAAKRAHA